MEPLALLILQKVVPMQTADLEQDLAVLEQAAAAQEPLAQQAVEASRTLAAGLSLELQRIHGFKQVIAAYVNGEPHPCCSSNWRDHACSQGAGRGCFGSPSSIGLPDAHS